MNEIKDFIVNKSSLKVVIRFPNWLGDAVMATPILEDFKKNIPQAEITVLAHEAICDLLAHNPYIDKFFTYSTKLPKKNISRMVINHLKQESYDLGLLLTGSFSSAWWFYRGNVPYRLGYKTHFRSPLITHGKPYPKNLETQHLVVTYKEILQPLGISVSKTSPTLYTTDNEMRNARKILEEIGASKGKLIGINPGAAYGSAKCWPASNFRDLTEKFLRNPEAQVIYFGDKGMRSSIDEMIKGYGSRVYNLAGKTNLRELITLISSLDLFVTNDSGPMHIAAALDKPLVAIFGSTNSVKTGPYGTGKVISAKVACSPCYLRKCPIDFRCMTSISAESVYKTAQLEGS